MAAKDLFIGMKADLRAAPIGGRAKVLQSPLGQAAREFLRVKRAIAGHLDPQMIGKRIHDRCPNPVQAARGLIGLARKLTARVEGA